MFLHPGAPPLIPPPSPPPPAEEGMTSRDASLPLPVTAMTGTEAEALRRAAPWRSAVLRPSADPPPFPHNTLDALFVSLHDYSLYSSLAARCSPPPASTPALQTRPQRLQTAPAFGLSVSLQASGLSPCHTLTVVPGGGSTARPRAPWRRRPLRLVPIPGPVPPGTAGTPASAVSSGPPPAARPCASAGRRGAARHREDPHGPPSEP